jgi:hypothetical protein
MTRRHAGFLVSIAVSEDGDGKRIIEVHRMHGEPDDYEPLAFSTLEGACANLADRLRALLLEAWP